MIIKDLREGSYTGVGEAPVSLSDMFATLLGFAKVDVPAEQQRFPSLLEVPALDRRIFGLCPRGTMLVGPDFKFCRRTTGEAEAYDLVVDPGEQNDLVSSSNGDPRIAEYDAQLTQHLIQGLSRAHNDKSYVEAQAADKRGYSMRGWSRPYPQKSTGSGVRNI